jgi:aspartyl-tRNA(Asn)/glutamyl-tRNA(Gln) amidotransferase subunit B
VAALAEQLPELPDDKRARFQSHFGLSPYDADVLVSDREVANYFEAVANGREGKQAANWVINELLGGLKQVRENDRDVAGFSAPARRLLDLQKEGVISGKIAKDVFEIMLAEGGDPRSIVESRGLKQVTDTGAIEKVVDEVHCRQPGQGRAGPKAKPTMLGWFVGQVMKSSGGKANPQAVNTLLKASGNRVTG